MAEVSPEAGVRPVASKHCGMVAVEHMNGVVVEPHVQPLVASQTLAVVAEQKDVPHLQAPPSQVNPVPQVLVAHGSVMKCIHMNYKNQLEINLNRLFIITKTSRWCRCSSGCGR